MRTTVAAAVACVIAISLSHAADTHAAIKKETNIPAQGLGPALRDLANERDFQIVYVSEDVNGLRTSGATGQLTTQEALTKLLDGTGLAYRHLDDKTITVYPVSANAAQSQAAPQPSRTSPAAAPASSGAEKEGSKSFWQRLRLAQAEARDTTRTSEPGSTDDSSGRERLMLEEVIVTAQKREERLIDVPISIAVVSGEQLDRSSVQSVTDAINRVPGVVASTNPTLGRLGGPAQIIIRGVAPPAGTSTTAYYLDSAPFGLAATPQAANIAPDASPYDLDRVEVLRGPQGTLYGLGASNGVVRVLTRDPDLTGFEAKGRALSSTTRHSDSPNYRGDLAVNVPLIDDRLAVRLVAGYQDMAGWIDRPNKEDVNDYETTNLRLKVKGQVTDELSVGAMAWRYRATSGGSNVSREDLTYNSQVDSPSSEEFDLYTVTLGYDAPWASISNSTSHLDYKQDNTIDFSIIGLTNVLTDNDPSSDVFSNEVILNSRLEGPWRWSVGGIYRDADTHFFQVRRNAVTGAIVAPTYLAPNIFHYNSESFAVFGELTREFLDGRLEITAGLRYFQDDVTSRELSVQTDVGGVPPTGLLTLESEFDSLTPRVVLNYHPNEQTTFYASYGEGFRSGFHQAFNTIRRAPQYPVEVESDLLKNYEVGAKGDILDGRLNYEVAAYYIDWQDVQQGQGVIIDPVNQVIFPAVVNTGAAKGPGIDVGLSADLTGTLTVGGSLSWNKLELAKDFFNNQTDPTPFYRKGDRLVGSPEKTATVFAVYDFALAGRAGQFSASANYISEVLNSRVNSPVGSVDIPSEAYWVTRASLAVDATHNWRVALFGDNLFDEYPVVALVNGIPDWTVRTRPRTFGLQFDYKF